MGQPLKHYQSPLPQSSTHPTGPLNQVVWKRLERHQHVACPQIHPEKKDLNDTKLTDLGQVSEPQDSVSSFFKWDGIFFIMVVLLLLSLFNFKLCL